MVCRAMRCCLVLPLVLLTDLFASGDTAVLPSSTATAVEASCDFESGLCGFVNDAKADFNWTRYTGKTITPDTGPRKDHTTGNGFFMYLESSSPQVSNDRCRLLSPAVRSGNYRASFWYSAYGSTVGILALRVRDDSSGYERMIWYYKPELNGSKLDDGWSSVTLMDVNLPDISGSYRFIWEGIRGIGSYGDIGLDDIIIQRTGEALPESSSQQCQNCDLPYSCTFESSACGTTNDWQSTDNFTWAARFGPGPSVNTGPTIDHTFKNASGHYMMIDAADRQRYEIAVLATPAFFSDCGCVDLGFWWHGYGSQLGSLEVSLEGLDEILWKTVADSRNLWRQANITFYPSAARPFRILFEAEVGLGPSGDYAIDDINIAKCSSCFTTTMTPTENLMPRVALTAVGDLTLDRAATNDPALDPSASDPILDQSATYDPAIFDNETEAGGMSETSLLEHASVSPYAETVEPITVTLGTTTQQEPSTIRTSVDPGTPTMQTSRTTGMQSTSTYSSTTLTTMPTTVTTQTTSATSYPTTPIPVTTTAPPSTTSSTTITTQSTTLQPTTTRQITTTTALSSPPPLKTTEPTTATTLQPSTSLPTTLESMTTTLRPSTPLPTTVEPTTTTLQPSTPLPTTVEPMTTTTLQPLPTTEATATTARQWSLSILTTTAEMISTLLSSTSQSTTTEPMTTLLSSTPLLTTTQPLATTTLQASTPPRTSTELMTTATFPSSTSISTTTEPVPTTMVVAQPSRLLSSIAEPGTTKMPQFPTTLSTSAELTATTTSELTTPQLTTAQPPTTTALQSSFPPTTIIIPNTATSGPYGQFFCDFESDGCMTRASSTGSAVWTQRKVSMIDKSTTGPITDHTFDDTALGTYVVTMITSDTPGVATLVTRNIYNPIGCNRLEFWIYAAGTDIGSLTASLTDLSTGSRRYLWVTSGQNISTWTKVVTLFKTTGPFAITFDAKGSSAPWTLFAIDDIRVSAVACHLVIDVAAVGGSKTTAQNSTIYVSGSYGVVQSSGFPNAYPDNYTQTWNVTVAADSKVGFILSILDTEACCDILKVVDPWSPAGAVLLRTSGVLYGEPVVYYSSGATIIVSFSADDAISLSGFRLQWWAVKALTTALPSTTLQSTPLASFGQFSCNFDVTWCNLNSDPSLGYNWTWSSGSSANYPNAGPQADHTTGLGAYVYANSQASSPSDLARLFTPNIYAADGCSVLTFYYFASGPALGSLTVRVLGSGEAAVLSSSTVVWYTSEEATQGWTRAFATVKYSGVFRLAFEAKRLSNGGVGDFAIDDVTVSTCGGLLNTVAPKSSTSTEAGGNLTLVTGSYGVIQSPNYPLDYPNLYQHTWRITVPPSKRVAIFIGDLLTEACCDMLQLTDGGTGRLLQTLRGAIASPMAYYSDTNQLTVTFTTDQFTQMRGWQLTWWAVAHFDAPPVNDTTAATATAATTTATATTVATTMPTTAFVGTATMSPSTASTTGAATAELNNEGLTTQYSDSSGYGAQSGASTGTQASALPSWVYLIIALAVVGVAATVALSVRLWRKRNMPNKVTDSTQQLQPSSASEDCEDPIEERSPVLNNRLLPPLPIKKDQVSQTITENKAYYTPAYDKASLQQSSSRQDSHRPHVVHNMLYGQLKTRNEHTYKDIVINPLHPRRQKLYLGENGQPTSQKPPKRLKKLPPLRSSAAVSAFSSALSSSQRSGRIAPLPPAAGSMHSIISLPGGGLRPSRPEMVTISGGQRPRDNPPKQSFA